LRRKPLPLFSAVSNGPRGCCS